MAAQAQPTQRGTEIQFPPNVTVTVSMKFAQPRMVAGKYGERYMFTTTDDSKFFLDPPVAAQIAALGINVREDFTITKRESGRKGEAAQWEVARLQPAAAAPAPQPVAPGPQSDGTFAIPRDPEAVVKDSLTTQPAPKPPMRAESSVLVREANALVDAYAEVLKRALDVHQGKVKPDEVRALLISTYIKQTRGAA